MRNSVSGNWQAFWKNDTEADYEIRYSYYNEDTDASGSHGFLHARWLSSGPRLVIQMLPDRIVLREYNGSSWTYHATAWVTTDEAKWYVVQAKLNGGHVEVWWGEKGGALSKIIDNNNVNLTTTERFRYETAPGAQFRFDDIHIFSDGVQRTTSFTYNDANEQTAMTVDGTTTNFAYDAWGRLTSRTRGSLEANYTWQYGSFLSQVTSNFPGEASQVDYVYDGLQNRRLKQVDSTDYTWTRYDANGAALADYTYDPTDYWKIGGRERSFHGSAEIAGSSPLTGTPSYYLQNHLGSTVATTNANKNIVASYQYTPYGEFLSESTTGDHATFGYTGHRLDRELDHYYAKYRYYNPTTMRWLKRDPLGMVDGTNVYAYVRGNVVNAVDASGLKLQVCLRDVAFSPDGPFTHAYIYDTTTNNTCGLVKGGDPMNLGIDNPATDNCMDVPDSECKEECVMEHCEDNINNRWWFPFVSDCHNAVNRSLNHCGLKTPLKWHDRFQSPNWYSYPYYQ